MKYVTSIGDLCSSRVPLLFYLPLVGLDQDEIPVLRKCLVLVAF